MGGMVGEALANVGVGGHPGTIAAVAGGETAATGGGGVAAVVGAGLDRTLAIDLRGRIGKIR